MSCCGGILGLVEGVTEFIPVSSTGHLIVVGESLGQTDARAKTFDIFIPSSAPSWRSSGFTAYGCCRPPPPRGPTPPSRRFFLNLAISFVPAAAIGFLIHDWIKEHLFKTAVVAWALILGGIVIVLIERWSPRTKFEEVSEVPPLTALGVGLAQVLSLIPGTSRSGATIMGGYALGLSRRAATELSFFLAIPIMFAATLYDLARAPAGSRHRGGLLLPPGSSSPSSRPPGREGVPWVRVASHSFAAFAWYRIVFGAFLLWLAT